MSDYTAKRIDDMEPFYGGLFLKARDELGVQSFGMAIVELSGGHEEKYPMHGHEAEGQEEVYVVLRGTGTMELEDGTTVDLDPETLVRVGPATKRKLVPGEGGMRLLALGGVPGQAYEAPGYSAVGAPDPLG
jgi:mannose-6-phosphate isomerase-like protein (cupin superfamily)